MECNQPEGPAFATAIVDHKDHRPIEGIYRPSTTVLNNLMSAAHMYIDVVQHARMSQQNQFREFPEFLLYALDGFTELERRETRKVGQREEKRTRGAGTKCNVRHGDLSPRRRPFVNVHMHSKCSNICSRNVQKGS